MARRRGMSDAEPLQVDEDEQEFLAVQEKEEKPATDNVISQDSQDEQWAEYDRLTSGDYGKPSGNYGSFAKSDADWPEITPSGFGKSIDSELSFLMIAKKWQPEDLEGYLGRELDDDEKKIFDRWVEIYRIGRNGDYTPEESLEKENLDMWANMFFSRDNSINFAVNFDKNGKIIHDSDPVSVSPVTGVIDAEVAMSPVILDSIARLEDEDRQAISKLQKDAEYLEQQAAKKRADLQAASGRSAAPGQQMGSKSGLFSGLASLLKRDGDAFARNTGAEILRLDKEIFSTHQKISDLEAGPVSRLARTARNVAAANSGLNNRVADLNQRIEAHPKWEQLNSELNAAGMSFGDIKGDVQDPEALRFKGMVSEIMNDPSVKIGTQNVLNEKLGYERTLDRFEEQARFLQRNGGLSPNVKDVADSFCDELKVENAKLASDDAPGLDRLEEENRSRLEALAKKISDMIERLFDKIAGSFRR